MLTFTVLICYYEYGKFNIVIASARKKTGIIGKRVRIPCGPAAVKVRNPHNPLGNWEGEDNIEPEPEDLLAIKSCESCEVRERSWEVHI